ncbi:unnamed protein product [Calicophoron daubneyi]|uniref:Uncharacterized protein n=1 Tax=Calicophoron daubneyi TaxID=300641 RepID=A0AAV2TPH3_CALDB
MPGGIFEIRVPKRKRHGRRNREEVFEVRHEFQEAKPKKQNDVPNNSQSEWNPAGGNWNYGGPGAGFAPQGRWDPNLRWGGYSGWNQGGWGPGSGNPPPPNAGWGPTAFPPNAGWGPAAPGVCWGPQGGPPPNAGWGPAGSFPYGGGWGNLEWGANYSQSGMGYQPADANRGNGGPTSQAEMGQNTGWNQQGGWNPPDSATPQWQSTPDRPVPSQPAEDTSGRQANRPRRQGTVIEVSTPKRDANFVEPEQPEPPEQPQPSEPVEPARPEADERPDEGEKPKPVLGKDDLACLLGDDDGDDDEDGETEEATLVVSQCDLDEEVKEYVNEFIGNHFDSDEPIGSLRPMVTTLNEKFGQGWTMERCATGKFNEGKARPGSLFIFGLQDKDVCYVLYRK